MRRLAILLAVLATISVASTATASLVLALQSPSDTSPTAARDTRLVLSPDGAASYRVPVSRRWTLRPPGDVLYYADGRGEPLVGVAAAAVYDAGYCRSARSARRVSNRGFAGFARTEREVGARATNRLLARRFSTAIDPTAADRPSRLSTVAVPDGVRSTLRLTLTEPGDCQPRAVAIDLVSRVGRGRVVTLVVVRDRGPGTVSDQEVEQILGSLAVDGTRETDSRRPGGSPSV